MAIVVKPEVFRQVQYDAAEIARVAAETADVTYRVHPDEGDGDVDLTIDVTVSVDENAPTSRCHIVSVSPIEFHIESGALERYSHPRTMGDVESALTFARLFLELNDRCSEEFGAPPVDDAVSHAHRVAWDVNLYGRASRLGFKARKPRYRYDFRNRHGFSRPVDQIFEQLWAGDQMTWADITKLSDTAAAPVVASRPKLSNG